MSINKRAYVCVFQVAFVNVLAEIVRQTLRKKISTYIKLFSLAQWFARVIH